MPGIVALSRAEFRSKEFSDAFANRLFLLAVLTSTHMTLNAGAAGDDDDLAGMEQLRARFAARGVAAKPGGRLRKSASVAAVSAVTSLAYERTAVESVHGGLVVSLDADCRAYRSEITALTKRCAELEEQAKPASELHQQLKTMGDELRLLRSQASDANRMRETLQTTVADLKQRLAEQQQQQQQADRTLAQHGRLQVRDELERGLAGQLGHAVESLEEQSVARLEHERGLHLGAHLRGV